MTSSTVTSWPSGRSPSDVTVASIAGSWMVTSPRFSSFSSTSTTTPENDSPTRPESSSASQRLAIAFSYWLARRPDSRIVSGSSGMAAMTHSGTSVPAQSATQTSPA